MAARRFREDTFDSFNKAMSRSGYGHALTTIDFVHRQIHDGYMFYIFKTIENVANNANLDILLSVPNTSPGRKPHLEVWQVSAQDGPGYIRLYEGVTTSDDGTEITPVNYERPSSKTSGCSTFFTPTVSDLGTLIYEERLQDPGGGFFGGGGGINIGLKTGQIELILKPNTKYLFRVTNQSGGAADLWVNLGWYELDQERADYR